MLQRSASYANVYLCMCECKILTVVSREDRIFWDVTPYYGARTV